MRGWIFDVYPDYKNNSMIIWLKTKSGVKRIEDKSFWPTFYVYHHSYEELRSLARDLALSWSSSPCRGRGFWVNQWLPYLQLEIGPAGNCAG